MFVLRLFGSNLDAAVSIKLTMLFIRGFVLFIIGAIFALVLNLLQVQRQITLFPGVLDNVFLSAWWVPPSCGTAAGMIGSLSVTSFIICDVLVIYRKKVEGLVPVVFRPFF